MRKNIFMIAMTLILAVVIGVLVPVASAEKTSGAKVDQAKLKQTLQRQYKEEMIKSYIEDYEADQIDELKAGYIKKYGTAEEMPEIKPLTNKEKDQLVAAIISQPDQPAVGAKVNDARIQAVIDQNRDYINQNDLVTGADIFNKLDTGYLFGLSNGGLTPDERKQAEDYLHGHLSQGEYDTAIDLYMKYVGLLN